MYLFHHPVFKNMATCIQPINTMDEERHCIQKQTNNWVETLKSEATKSFFSIYYKWAMAK